jgi:hypothetical protein
VGSVLDNKKIVPLTVELLAPKVSIKAPRLLRFTSCVDTKRLVATEASLAFHFNADVAAAELVVLLLNEYKMLIAPAEPLGPTEPGAPTPPGLPVFPMGPAGPTDPFKPGEPWGPAGP